MIGLVSALGVCPEDDLPADDLLSSHEPTPQRPDRWGDLWSLLKIQNDQMCLWGHAMVEVKKGWLGPSAGQL